MKAEHMSNVPKVWVRYEIISMALSFPSADSRIVVVNCSPGSCALSTGKPSCGPNNCMF